MPGGGGHRLDEAESGADPCYTPEGMLEPSGDSPQRTQVVHWKGGKRWSATSGTLDMPGRNWCGRAHRTSSWSPRSKDYVRVRRWIWVVVRVETPCGWPSRDGL